MADVTMKTHAIGKSVAKAIETRIGRMTFTALKEEEEEFPRYEIIWTITSLTTSSSMAARDDTTPKRLVTSPLELNKIKVVPRLVDQRAAPAANAWRGVAFAMPIKGKDRPIGRRMPVEATATESSKSVLSGETDVDRPLSKTSKIIPRCKLRYGLLSSNR